MTTLSEALRDVCLRVGIGQADRFVLEAAADALDRAEKPPAYANDFCAGLSAGPAAAMAGLDASMETLKSPDAALDAEAEALRFVFFGHHMVDAQEPEVLKCWRLVALKAREMHRRSVELIEPKHADLLRERDEWRDQWKEMARSKWSQLKDAERERDAARAEVERLRAEISLCSDPPHRALPTHFHGEPIEDWASALIEIEKRVPDRGVAAMREIVKRYDALRAAPPVYLTDIDKSVGAISGIVGVSNAAAVRECITKHTRPLDQTPPTINLTDIEAAVKEWGDWTDWLTAVLRKHTRPLDREGLIGAMIEFRHRVQMEGGIPAIPGYADAVLRYIGAQTAQPVEPKPAKPRGEWTEEQREAAWDMHLRTRGYTIDCNAARDHICLALAHVAPLFAPEPAKPEPAALHPPTAQSIDLATIVPSNGHTDPDALIAKPRGGFVVDRDRFNGIANRAGLAVARAIDECIAEIERQRAEFERGGGR